MPRYCRRIYFIAAAHFSLFAPQPESTRATERISSAKVERRAASLYSAQQRPACPAARRGHEKFRRAVTVFTQAKAYRRQMPFLDGASMRDIGGSRKRFADSSRFSLWKALYGNLRQLTCQLAMPVSRNASSAAARCRDMPGSDDFRSRHYALDISAHCWRQARAFCDYEAGRRRRRISYWCLAFAAPLCFAAGIWR